MSETITSPAGRLEKNSADKNISGLTDYIFRFQAVIVACLMLTAFLPMGYIHYWQVLKKTHYQFAVYIPILLILLYFKNSDESSSRTRQQPGQMFVDILMTALLCTITVVSIWKWSPWMNYATALFAVFVYMYWLKGINGIFNALPYVLIAACALPLPFELDTYVTTYLRNSATDWCSKFLDVMGIPNLTYKNVIELNGKELFVADACSGIHSLFVMITAAVFISVWNNRNLLHIILLIICTIGIVMVENVTRLVTVSYAWTLGHNLTEGNPHKILGFILFGMSLLFLWSFDNLLVFLFGVQKGKARNYTTNILDAATNRTIPQAPRSLIPWSGMIFCCLIFPFLGILQLSEAATQIVNLPPIILPEYPIPEFNKEVMPDILHGLKLTGNLQVKRVPEDPMGKNSQAWEYRRDGLFVRISLDYPYDLPHDMCQCYYNTGWTILNRNIVKVNDQLNFSEATMDRPNFGHGYVAFVQFNAKGKYQFERKADEIVGINDVNAVKNKTQSMFFNLLNRNKSQKFIADSNRIGPWFQVHMIAISHQPISPEVQEDLRVMFKEAQQILVSKTLTHLPNK